MAALIATCSRADGGRRAIGVEEEEEEEERRLRRGPSAARTQRNTRYNPLNRKPRSASEEEGLRRQAPLERSTRTTVRRRNAYSSLAAVVTPAVYPAPGYRYMAPSRESSREIRKFWLYQTRKRVCGKSLLPE